MHYIELPVKMTKMLLYLQLAKKLLSANELMYNIIMGNIILEERNSLQDISTIS